MGEEEPKALKRALGLWSATAINVGAIIGGGIFVVTGIVAGLAGSALVVSMVVAGIIAVFTALSFAELTAWQPVEGSVYEYTCQLVSPFSGFLAGWMWMLSNTFAGAAVSLGFAYYFSGVFPVCLLAWLRLCCAWCLQRSTSLELSSLLSSTIFLLS